jgi:hypothetical protein
VEIHVRLGVALFIIELLVDCWLAWYLCKDLRNHMYLALQLVGGLISLLALDEHLRYLLEGQIIFQCAFGLLMLHSLRCLRAGANALT